jgi:hypothetical protein
MFLCDQRIEEDVKCRRQADWLDDIRSGGVSSGHKFVQIFARSLVPIMIKNGKVDACHRRWASGGSIWSRSRGMKPRFSVSSLVTTDAQAAIALGEIYPESGMFKRRRSTTDEDMGR